MNKILILSHNPLSTYNSMGMTLLRLFSEFPPEALCQLYIYPSLPDTDHCASFFRITDKDVLRSYASLFRVRGQEVFPTTQESSAFEQPQDEKMYRDVRNKTPLRMLLRDAMWRFSPWYNRPLKRWLAEQKPNCLFVAPGSGVFFYRIAQKLAKKLQIPIVTYVCDDYYFLRGSGLLGRLHQRSLCKAIEKLLKASSHVVAISQPLTNAYHERFGVPATTIMTGTGRPIAYEVKSAAGAQSLFYAGNIRSGRNESLAAVGRVIDEINAAHGTQFSLELYTGEKEPAILSAFEGISSIHLHGFLTGTEFERVYDAARLHLHIESFAASETEKVKFSISTKIADCLGSGCCLVAYAPPQVASMQYLLEQQCALTATEPKQLRQVLERAFFDPSAADAAAQNALLAARNYHDCRNNSLLLAAILEHVCDNELETFV